MLRTAAPISAPLAAVALAGAALFVAPVLAQTAPKPPVAEAQGLPAPPDPPVPPAPAPYGVSHSVTTVEGKVVADAYWSEKDEATLDARMRDLAAKLARMEGRLKAEDAARSAHLREVMAHVEDRVREASERAAGAAKAELSPERIQEITARAQERAQLSDEQIRAITARAEAQAEAGIRAAEAAQRAIEKIRPQLEEMNRQLEPRKPEDADPAT